MFSNGNERFGRSAEKKAYVLGKGCKTVIQTLLLSENQINNNIKNWKEFCIKVWKWGICG